MLNVCIDVDLTLIDEEGELMPGVVEALEALRKFPCELTLWSAAGAEYARSVAARHKVEYLFAGIAGKPDLAIDDDPQSLVLNKLIVKQPASQWNELLPQTLQALHEIREEL
jgi:phosphoglycolate phosphatase-like HAD superfamily hydrolase